jgi:Tfp pilus assembly protein PilF
LDRDRLRHAVDLLVAGEWQRAHAIVQDDEDDLDACWAHAIVHLMEGDLGNADYWYRRAGRARPQDADASAEVADLRDRLTRA